MNSTGPKRRRRKLRSADDPHELLKEAKPGAHRRASARPIPPFAILEPSDSGREEWTAPHSDVELWYLQLGDCFGTRSSSVVAVFLRQLSALVGRGAWDETNQRWQINEDEFAALLAIINSLKPRNEMEAAHAAQMVAVHLMTMKLATRALRYEYDAQTAALAGKLARTFTLQREAFERIRKPNRTTRQSIKVRKELHQHVHYHDHRGDAGTDGQSDATSDADRPAKLPALPGSEEKGRVVPITSRPRKSRVPDARR